MERAQIQGPGGTALGSREERDLQAAAIAEASGDAETMHRASNTLIRLELYERAWQLRIGAARVTERSPLPEWDGDDLAGRSILIRAYTPRGRIGKELRLARFIAPVARQALRCMVLAEPRLVRCCPPLRWPGCASAGNRQCRGLRRG